MSAAKKTCSRVLTPYPLTSCQIFWMEVASYSLKNILAQVPGGVLCNNKHSMLSTSLPTGQRDTLKNTHRLTWAHANTCPTILTPHHQGATRQLWAEEARGSETSWGKHPAAATASIYSTGRWKEDRGGSEERETAAEREIELWREEMWQCSRVMHNIG